MSERRFGDAAEMRQNGEADRDRLDTLAQADGRAVDEAMRVAVPLLGVPVIEAPVVGCDARMHVRQLVGLLGLASMSEVAVCPMPLDDGEAPARRWRGPGRVDAVEAAKMRARCSTSSACATASDLTRYAIRHGLTEP